MLAIFKLHLDNYFMKNPHRNTAPNEANQGSVITKIIMDIQK